MVKCCNLPCCQKPSVAAAAAAAVAVSMLYWVLVSPLEGDLEEN